MLKLPGFWDALPLEKRQELYSMLPEPADNAGTHDPDVNPLVTEYRPHIEEALRKWQDDLKDGKEDKKWRREAMQASVDRKEGKFDEYKASERERYWGVKDEGEDVKSIEGVRENTADDGVDHGEKEKSQIREQNGVGKEESAEEK